MKAKESIMLKKVLASPTKHAVYLEKEKERRSQRRGANALKTVSRETIGTQ